MARVDVHQSGIRELVNSREIEAALLRIGEKVQDEAVRISTAEAVDTGLYAASWRVTVIRQGRTTAVRVLNTAKSVAGFPYPAAIENGFRHHRSGRHIRGRHILLRSLNAARI